MTPVPRPHRRCAAALLAATAALAASAAAPAQAPPAAVRVETARVESVGEQRLVTGELRAVHRAEVASQEDGRVVELPVREGQPVEAGAVLARLDDRRLRAEHARAEADLAVARAVVLERRAMLELRERDLEALRESYRRDAAKAKELRDAEAEQAIAAARLTASERAVEAAEAWLDLLAVRVDDTVLTAPFAGVVIERRTEIGQWLGEGDAAVVLVAVDPIEALLAVPQESLAGVRDRTAPLPVQITATGEERRAETWRIVPDIDRSARRFLLVAPLENDDGALVPGLSVIAWVATGAVADRLTVPKDAVLRSDTGAFVYAVRSDGGDAPPSAAMVAVDLRFPVGDRWVVEAPGLRGGEAIVVEGNERLYPGAPVRVVPAPATSAP